MMPRRPRYRLQLNLQGLEIRDALPREFPTLLNEVVLDAARLRGGEGLHPIDGPLAHRHLWSSPAASSRLRLLRRRRRDRGVHVDILQVHRVESTRVLHEV